jgi:hypothetical protein
VVTVDPLNMDIYIYIYVCEIFYIYKTAKLKQIMNEHVEANNILFHLNIDDHETERNCVIDR